MRRGKRRPPWMRRTLRQRWRDRPRTPAGYWHLARELTSCKLGRHKDGERKFNGGSPVRLCAHCRVIVRYER